MLPRRTRCIINLPLCVRTRRIVRNDLPKKEGYTFTEILVVLAIIAVMMTILIPRLAFQQKGAGLKGAASEIMSALRTARRMAISERVYRSVAVAFDLYSIPGRFVMMAEPREDEFFAIGEERRLPENIAIVSMNTLGWTKMDVTRTDDVNLDGTEDTGTAATTVYNPQRTAAGNPGPNGIVNPIYRMVKFRRTGTSDATVIYLWNIEDGRTPLPSPTVAQTRSHLHLLGVPPGLGLVTPTDDQEEYFQTLDEASLDDAYYYTIVVNAITGNVNVYDYAWGNGTPQWDRKKDGE